MNNFDFSVIILYLKINMMESLRKYDDKYDKSEYKIVKAEYKAAKAEAIVIQARIDVENAELAYNNFKCSYNGADRACKLSENLNRANYRLYYAEITAEVARKSANFAREELRSVLLVISSGKKIK